MKWSMEKNTAAGKILRLLRILILPTYVLAAAIAVLSAIDRKWSFRIALILSAIGLLNTTVGIIITFPMLVAGRIPQAAVFIGLTPENTEPVVREAIMDGLGTGWRIMAVGMGILLVLSILELVFSKENKDDKHRQTHSKFTGVTG